MGEVPHKGRGEVPQKTREKPRQRLRGKSAGPPVPTLGVTTSKRREEMISHSGPSPNHAPPGR